MPTELMSPRPNHYGMLAWDHMARYLPDRYHQIPDPTSFFFQLGEQVAEEIAETTAALAAHTSTSGDDYFDRVGRMRMAQLMAEEKVLAELVFLHPTEDPDDAPRDETGAFIGADPGMGPWTALWDGGDPET